MIALIAAYDANRAIGFQGKIPWNIPGEQRRFRELTTGSTVIMGRRTFLEIGKPLSHRTTILLSHTISYQSENCFTAHSLEEAIAKSPTSNIYIAGGAALYAQSIPLVEKMYLTEIHSTFSGDTFFPSFPREQFQRKIDAYVPGIVPFTYVTYTRIHLQSQEKY